MKKNHLVDYMQHWKDPAKLQAELGVYSFPHPTLPLVLFKYDQIESPKFHPVVRHSRSTILEKDTWNLVSLGFTRFFNYGEDWAGQETFNWNNFFVNEKIDGSFVQLFFYGGEWHVSLSGSWGFQEVLEGSGKSWRDFIWKCLDLDKLLPERYNDHCGYEFTRFIPRKQFLNRNYTYIFEFVSPYTKVVRAYKEPDLYLLSIMSHAYDPYELNHNEVDTHAKELGFKRPDSYNFKSIKEIEDFLTEKAASDPTFEGVVCNDGQGRLKCKNKMYLTLAHMKDNGNLAAPKNIIPWILEGNQSELLTYFPEFRQLVESMTKVCDDQYNSLQQAYIHSQGIENQKDFALTIKDLTKFTGILFELRKLHGKVYAEELLRAKWQDSNDVIFKFLFKKEKKDV